MGQDKAHVSIGSITLLEQAVRRAHVLADRVLVVGRTEEQVVERIGDRTFRGAAGELVVEHYPDAYPGAGPLGGIATALRLSRPHACLIAPCDMPLLGEELLRRLVRSHARDTDCTLLMNPVIHRPEPLVGVYAARCLPFMEQAIDAGRLAIWRTLRQLTVRYVTPSPDELDQLTNLNTPRDLSRLDTSSA
jgi:molybdenum cofactor guanylyltransferase